MTDQEIYLKACERFRKTHGGHLVFMADLVIFLEKEIDSLREKNEELKTAIDRNEKEIKINNDFAESVADAVRYMANKWTETSERIERLGQTIENGVNVGQIEDGGKMTLNRNTTLYTQIVDKLMLNGYYVCTHFDDKLDVYEDNDTITIEYWRA